jgi:16S rRNA processing protein RimM
MWLTLPDPEMADQKLDKAGSLAKDEPAFLLIGRLQKSHGVKGELAMRVDTDFPERICPGKSVYLGDEKQKMIVASTRWKGNLLLIRFSGITNPEDAFELTNLKVYKSTRNLPKLPEGKYYHHQLLGLQVWEGEEHLGELVEIMETGANDVYVVQKEGAKELLIPAIPDVVREIDPDNGRMSVILLEGLRD